MAVVPSGKVTAEGKTIWKAAPTKASIAREVSAKRVQTYRHGKKVSDTSRVQLPSGEWTAPEKALAVSKEGSAIAEEAKGKIQRRQELEQTIRGRFEREAEEVRVEKEEEKKPTLKKLAVTLIKEPTKPRLLFPAILATKEAQKEEKRKEAIIEHPELFPSLFGLQRETFVGRKASKVITEQTPFGPRETFEESVVGKPRKVTLFTPTGLLTLPQPERLSKEERFKKGAEEKFKASAFGAGLREVTGQFGVAGTTFIVKPIVKAAIVPLPKETKERVKEIAPTTEEVRIAGEELITKGTGEVAYRLGTARGIGSTALTIGTFVLGVGVVGVAAKGTKFAKPIAAGIKLAPTIFVGALGAGRIVSGGFRVKAGEAPLVALSKEVGTFGGQLIAFGLAAKGLQLGFRGAKAIIPRKFTPVKLVSARERIIVGKGGQAERAFEIETALGRQFKARKTPKIKPARLAFKTSAVKIGKTSQGQTILLGTERVGVAKISFPKGVSPGKGVAPKVSITKVTGLTIQDPTLILGKKPVLGKAVFPKTPTRQELIPVKGFKRLEIRDIDLIILGKGKPQRFPFVTTKEVQVGPAIRKGDLIKQTIFKAQKVKGLKPVELRETTFALLQPKARVEKAPKIVTKKPIDTRSSVNRIIDLTSGKKREFAEIKVTKKKFDIGELKLKDVTESRFIEVGQELPTARKVALQRLSQSAQQIAKTVSVSTKQVKVSKAKKPTIGVIKAPSRARLALGKVSKQILFIPPVEVFRGELKQPKVGVIAGEELIREPELAPALITEPVRATARLPRQALEPIVIPGLGQAREPTVDIISEQGTDVIKDVVQITVPGPTPRPRPEPQPGVPFVPGGGLFFGAFPFFGGTGIIRRRGRTKQAFGFTGDFIASVRNEFAPQPKQRIFTGQERRRKIRGAKFVTPLSEVPNGGIFGLIRRQLEA